MKHIPPPPYTLGKPLRALIFDSKYDSYKARASSMSNPFHIIRLKSVRQFKTYICKQISISNTMTT